MISVSPSWTWFLKDTDDCWNVTWISQCCTRDVSPVCPPFDKAEWKCSSVAGGCTCSVAPAFRLCSTSASLKMTSFVSSEVDICFSCCCNFHVTPKNLTLEELAVPWSCGSPLSCNLRCGLSVVLGTCSLLVPPS